MTDSPGNNQAKTAKQEVGTEPLGVSAGAIELRDGPKAR